MSAADARGEFFEIKMVTLLFLRCIICVCMKDFKIATNMEAAGAFDDIILIYQLLLSENLYCALFQLKHKLRQMLNKTNLSQPSGDFSLLKYFQSYLTIQDTASTNPDLKACGRFEHFKFFLFTNAAAHTSLDQFACSPFHDHICFNTSVDGKIISFDGDNKVLDWLKSDLNCNVSKSEFLKSFHIYTSQAREDKLEVLIKEEIKNLWQIPNKEVNSLYTELLEAMLFWWREGKNYLTSRSGFWLKIVKKHINKISGKNISKYKNFKVEFEASSIINLKNKIIAFKRGIIHVVANSRHTCLSALKVYVAVNDLDSADKTRIVVSLKTLIEKRDEIISAWKSRWCSTLIIECEAVHSQLSGTVSTLVTAMQEMNSLVLVLVSTNEHDLPRSLKCKTRHLLTYDDQCHWSDLTQETQEHLLDKIIHFQGTDVVLRSIIGEDYSFTNQLSAVSISEIMQPIVDVGKDLAKTIAYFIPRTLVSSDGTKLSIDTVTDVEERVVLVVAEPGMGKSTLLTHLAETAKKKDPYLWIARVDLADSTNYLKNLNTSSLTDWTSVDFLETFCSLNNTAFEKNVLRHCLMDEKMVLMLDGVDEVCPCYEEKIIPLLKALLKTNLKQIWITSRVVVKKTLETTLNSRSYFLSPFTKEDQEHFLFEVWKANNSHLHLDDQCLKTFAKDLMLLAAKSFNETNLIIEIPQMTLMLSESYEEHLRKYGATSALPFHKRLDILDLYESFVTKTFEKYLTEKKKIDINLAANKPDHEIQLKRFLKNHTQAALMLILSSEECANLGIENSIEFLKEVDDGREKTGLIDTVSEGKAHFIHRTLAEYLSALWLADNHASNHNLLESKIIHPSFKVVREFLDRILAKNFQLHTAILNRDLKAFDKLISSGVSVDETDGGGRTALHIAVSCSGSEQHSDFLSMAQKLLEHGASTDVLDKVLGWRPLQLADKMDAWTVAGLILKAGGDETDMIRCRDSINQGVYKELIKYLSTKDSSCARLINISALEGELTVLRYLFEERGEYNVNQGVDLAYPMHHAASGGCIYVMQYLNDMGIPYDVADDDGNYPLHFAVKRGSIDSVKFLVEQSIDVNKLNKKLESALMFAVNFGHSDVVKYLLGHGSDTLLNNVDGRSALHLASMHGDLEIVKCLMDKGTDINTHDFTNTTSKLDDRSRYSVVVKHFEYMKNVGDTCDNDGNSPVHLASFNGHLNVVKHILKYHGVIIDNDNQTGNKPLHLASSQGHLHIVKYLINIGANIDKQNNDNLTALDCAIQFGRKDVVAYIRAIQEISGTDFPLHEAAKNADSSVFRYFVEKYPDIEKLNDDGNTVLWIACIEGNLDVTSDLINLGASIKNGPMNYSPLHASASSGDPQVIKLILERGVDLQALSTNGESALWLAAKYGKCEAISTLIDAGSSMSADNKGYTPLHASVTSGDPQVIQLLLDKGSDIEAVNRGGKSALWLAARNGQSDAVRTLLDAGASMRSDIFGNTPLHAAAMSGELKGMHLLLENGADTEVVSSNGASALFLAAIHGNCDGAKTLLDAGASMHGDNEGFTPFHASVLSDEPQVIHVLLESGADIDAFAKNGESALCLATKMGKYDAARMLLVAGASSKADTNGETPLHAAVWFDDPRWITLLLEYGADTEVVSKKGITPLCLAARNGKYNAVKTLIDLGATMSGDSMGNTPLHASAVTGDCQMVQLLLDCGADIEALTNGGETALWLAAINGKSDAVKTLQDAGATMWTDANLNTPLHASAISGNTRTMQLLLERGADKEAVTKGGETALWLAAISGKCDAVRTLLDAGATMRTNNNLNTPLHASAISGKTQAMKLLLERGAEMEAVNKDQETALHLAVSHNHLETVTFLIEQGSNRNAKTSRNLSVLDIATINTHFGVAEYLRGIGCRSSVLARFRKAFNFT